MRQLQQVFNRCIHGLLPHRFPVPSEHMAELGSAVRARHANVDQAHRLIRRAPARPGNSRDACAEIRASREAHARSHGGGNGLAYCAVLKQQGRGNAK
jgi:hypothetical protein